MVRIDCVARNGVLSGVGLCVYMRCMRLRRLSKVGVVSEKADKKEVDDNVVKTWKPLFMRKNVFGFITGRVFSDCMMNDVEA